MEEFMILGLRRMEGISEAEFQRTFQVSLCSIYKETLSKWQAAGCLAKRDGFWFLTEQGIDVSNTVLADFMKI